ncbi:hypothetical protein Dsin_016809 [Dipteronia sinensis]|uniref:Uncharacterized protein n=1 Tax=Dipteronia sinensis TaxID=43782 RepID=A0AAE0AEL6_9ROSI|nr:hypothetical protein Dsin_016809 [Dipteronia sinensis]
MLLRSASTPILKSCSFRSSPEPDLLGIWIQTTTTRSVSMSLSSSSKNNKIPRTLSDGDLNRLHMSSKKEKEKKKNKSFLNNHQLTSQDETKTTATSYLHNGLVLDNGCVGGGGGRGGVSGGGGGGDGYGDSGRGSESMDVYYQKMIEMYPGDALILANYAKFLKDVRGNFVKAEEYCERAILAKPDEGIVLCLYGDLIWNNYKDAPRAQTYFDQALHSAPDDCYVLASYARFLWDAGVEEEEEEEEEEDFQAKTTKTCTPPQPSFLPPLTAAA